MVVDLSLLGLMITIVVAVLGMGIAYATVTDDKWKLFLKGGMVLTGVSLALFLLLLLVLRPPLAVAESVATPAAQDQELREQLSALRAELAELRTQIAEERISGAGTGRAAVVDLTTREPAFRQALSECDTAEADILRQMIRRCNAYDNCPEDAILEVASRDEYHRMMSLLDHVIVFFPRGEAVSAEIGDAPTQDIRTFAASLNANSTTIIVARASKPGSVIKNRELSRNRAIWVAKRLKELNPTAGKVVPMSYGEETLQVTRHDVATYGLNVDTYTDLDRLNQTAFVFRFDCPDLG